MIRQRVGYREWSVDRSWCCLLVVGWLDVVGGKGKTYGLFVDGARSVGGSGGSHLLGGKGLSDLSRHIERCVLESA